MDCLFITLRFITVPLLSLLLSLGLWIFFIKIKKNKSVLRNYINNRKDLYKTNERSLLERGLLYVIFKVLMYIDGFQNIIRLLYEEKLEPSKFKKWKASYSTSIEIIIFIYFIISFAAFCYGQRCEYYAGFFFWRVLTINFISLGMICEVNLPDLEQDVFSPNRTLFLTIANIIELTIGYSYLYFYSAACKSFDVDTFIATLKIFSTLGVDDIVINPTTHFQKFILIIQMFSFIILFLLFMTKMNEFQYIMDKKKKNARGNTDT
jgi:hypothetical protein